MYTHINTSRSINTIKIASAFRGSLVAAFKSLVILPRIYIICWKCALWTWYAQHNVYEEVYKYIEVAVFQPHALLITSISNNHMCSKINPMCIIVYIRMEEPGISWLVILSSDCSTIHFFARTRGVYENIALMYCPFSTPERDMVSLRKKSSSAV